MPEIRNIGSVEVKEQTREINVYQEHHTIKPESNISLPESINFLDSLFKPDRSDDDEDGSKDERDAGLDIEEKKEVLEKRISEYFADLKSRSECPDTIPDEPFQSSDLKKRTPEKTAEMREEFDDKKTWLKRQWEIVHGRPWPKYEHDVYSSNGKLIRKAGSDYDVHHILPLGMGGTNEVENITPLSAEVHYDKQGIHAPDSPYSKIDKILGGMG